MIQAWCFTKLLFYGMEKMPHGNENFQEAFSTFLQNQTLAKQNA